MIDRREFVAASLSAGMLGLAPAGAALAEPGKNPLDALIPDYDLPEEHLPRIVKLRPGYKPFEVHVDPDHFYLYWTLPNNMAMRYTAGIGMGNLYHAGIYYVGMKREWPRWVPTPDMLQREPEVYEPVKAGMPGGLDNPLGARALYLFTKEKGDSLLRIHGTNNPATIGGAVTNGCARLVNDQIVELYDKVPIGTRVVLNQRASGGVAHS